MAVLLWFHEFVKGGPDTHDKVSADHVSAVALALSGQALVTGIALSLSQSFPLSFAVNLVTVALGALGVKRIHEEHYSEESEPAL